MVEQTKLFNDIRGFLVLYSVLGLWPIWPNSKFKIGCLINFIFFIAYVLCMFWSVFYFNQKFPYHTLSAIAQFLYLAGILVTHLSIIIEAFLNRDAQMRLIAKISYADQLLHTKLQLKISYQNEKNAIFKRLASVIFILAAVRTILTFVLYYDYGINTFPYRVTLSAWIIQLRSVQVLFFVYLLRTRLQFVNDQLKEMLIFGNFYFRQSENNGIFILDVPLAKRSLYDRLMHLKQVYGELYEICELINGTFGWSLLTIIVQSLIDFIVCFYRFYLAVQESNRSLGIICLVDLVPIIALVVSMAYICSSCAYCVSSDVDIYKWQKLNRSLSALLCIQFQTRVFGSDLHRIMQNSKSEDLNDLIREFSFQILQEPIAIAANDFFRIEYQLLSSVRNHNFEHFMHAEAFSDVNNSLL